MPGLSSFGQSTNSPPLLPPVTVSASKLGESLTSPSIDQAAEQKNQDPGAFTLRGTERLREGRGMNFDDLLHGVPGVTLQSENEMEVSKISIRGSGILSEDEPLGLNVLLDGFTFNQGDGEVILEDFDVATIKYAEIYRGASAFKYGSLSLGGAINLTSITGYDASPLAVRVEGGSYGFIQAQVTSGMVDGPFDYYVSLDERGRSGYREHSVENTEIMVANFGYRFSSNAENRLFLILDRTDRLLPGGLTKAEMQADPRQTDPDAPAPGATPYAISQDYNKDWYYLRLADKVTLKTLNTESDAGAFWWHRNITEKGPSNDEGAGGIQDFYADNVGLILNFTGNTELFGQRNVITAGFTPNVEREVDQNFVNVNGSRGGPLSHDAELSVNAPLFAEDQQYFSDQFSAVIGVQATYAQRHFSDFYFHPETSDDIIFRGINPKAGLIWAFNSNNQVFFNVSRTWQAPSFDNMVDFDGDPDVEFTPLEPQQAWTAELGTRGEYGRVDWDFAIYRSWVRNELLEINNSAGANSGAVNIPHAIHQGIELGVDVELLNAAIKQGHASPASQSLALDQTFTLNDFTFEQDPTYGNNRIGGIPIYLYEAELRYSTPWGLRAGPTLDWNITKYPVDHENTLFADPYALLGFRISYESKYGFTVFFEAKNLTDKVYASSVDPIPSAQFAANGPYTLFHPGDGRSFYGGLSWAW
ncbi:MAG TPA: TonB-dependent receptor [Verrucomicrobiae bacterium]|jgi:iron complex outermembrane receptor protein